MVFLPAVRAAHGSERTDSSPLSALPNITQVAAPGPGPSSTATSSRFSKPNGSMPPPNGPVIRKQNIACDACRTRKIRCQRTTIEQICEQCTAKGCECTSHYVEQLANSKSQKKAGGKRRRKSEDDGEEQLRETRTPSTSAVQPINGHILQRPPLNSTLPSQNSASLSRSSSSTPSRTPSVPLPSKQLAAQHQQDLLRYMFASEAVRHSQWAYNDLASIRQCDLGESDLWEEMGGQVWREAPSTAHAALEDEGLQELADDLLDSFFSIAHIRYPLLETEQFRARFSDPDSHPDGPLYHPLLAVALAWGARFSESPTLVADREEISSRDSELRFKGFSRSRMVQLLVIRAREVAEVCKAFRYAKMENVQLGILLEPLLAQAPFLKEGYQPTCIVYASRHFEALGLSSPSGLLVIADAKKRAEAVFTWWLLSLSDGFRSAFNRLRPALNNGYFSVESQQQFQAIWDTGTNSTTLLGPRGEIAGRNGGTRPTGSDDETLAWLAASNAGSTMCRDLSTQLWTPQVREKGISLQTLQDFADCNSQWRDTHLSKLGVPSKWPEDWDFLAAITACSTDVYYHCLWLVVMRAIKDFGVLDEGNGASSQGMDVLERYRKEADHGAMRIAALAAVLTENGYLKLDPLVIYHPIYEAGLYLAAQVKEECLICVAGLRQYSTPFPSVWALAEEIETLYLSAKAASEVQSSAGIEVHQRTHETMSVNGVSTTQSTGPDSHGGLNDPWFYTQVTKTQPSLPVAMPQSSNGPNRDVWPDGTPVPSRDVAWTLFDWLHQM